MLLMVKTIKKTKKTYKPKVLMYCVKDNLKRNRETGSYVDRQKDEEIND